jgi:hypothetical protein
VTSSPLDACTMKVTATPFCATPDVALWSMIRKRLPGNRAQRDLSVILWISRSTRFHVLAISVPAPQHARGRFIAVFRHVVLFQISTGCQPSEMSSRTGFYG